MDLLHSGRFDGFCLVSSDSDFTRLAARIREQGVDVFGFGEQKTPEIFRQACKRFIYTENLSAVSQPDTSPLPGANSPPYGRHELYQEAANGGCSPHPYCAGPTGRPRQLALARRGRIPTERPSLRLRSADIRLFKAALPNREVRSV